MKPLLTRYSASVGFDIGGLMTASQVQARAIARLIASIRASRRVAPPPSPQRRGPLIDGPTDQQRENGRFQLVTLEHKNTVKEQNKVYRRVPLIQTMMKRGTLDPDLYAACAWYLARHEGSGRGIRSCLDIGTGGGSGRHHGPSDEAVMGAIEAADLEWARRFLPRGELALFDRVVLEDDTFEDVGRTVYPDLRPDTASRKVKLRFQLAASRLHEGIAHRLEIG